MKKTLVTVMTAMAMLAMSSPLYADQQAGMQTPGEQQHQAGVAQVESAKQLLGMEIRSQQGEDIGEIQDIKIDTRNGRIKFLTVSTGGVLGVGGQEEIAVPVEAFDFQEDGARLTVDRSKLDNAPQATELTDANFQRELESHYGVSPAWQQDPQQQMGEQMQPQQMKQEKSKSMEGESKY